MALPQGIYFRATDNQVDPTDYEAEVGGSTENYPRTTDKGNTVGWETSIGSGTRNRDETTDVRLRGVAFLSNSSEGDYRIDLPSTGAYRVRCAIGDSGSAQTNCTAALLDDTSPFKTIVSDVNIASDNWYDAAGNLHTSEANFVANEEYVEHIFSSTILRLRIGGSLQAGNTAVAFLYVEAAPDSGGSGRVVFRGS